VRCSTDDSTGAKQVKALLLSSTPSSAAVEGLKGKLPPASSLKLLPGLTTVVISGQPGVTGPVPASWADVPQLEDVRLHDNDLNGELPDSWSALKALKVGVFLCCFATLCLWRLSRPLNFQWATCLDARSAVLKQCV
jgi:hypothetical protein